MGCCVAAAAAPAAGGWGGVGWGWQAQDGFAMDDYPTGTNAVVAVISYTGFDMVPRSEEKSFNSVFKTF